MLLTRQTREPPAPKLNMTPLIDIIFQLLVFFMCTATFSVENVLRTQLPRASAQEAQAPDFPPSHIRLSPAAEGVLVTCDGEACQDFDDLVAKLKARRAISADLQVIIEGEGPVDFGYMARALDACHQADLRHVAFSPKGVTP